MDTPTRRTIFDRPEPSILPEPEFIQASSLAVAVFWRPVHVLAALAWVFLTVAAWQVWGWGPGLIVFVGTLVVAYCMSEYESNEGTKDG